MLFNSQTLNAWNCTINAGKKMIPETCVKTIYLHNIIDLFGKGFPTHW